MFRLITLVLPLLAGIPGNFKLVGSKHGVDVYRQMSSRVIDLVAEGNIEAPPDVVRSVVLDFANATKVTDNIIESRVLQQNDRELIVYQRLRLPVINDRDFTVRVTWGRKGDVLTTRSAIDNSRGPQPREGIVRMSLLQGGWELEPIRGGTATHARYRVQVDLAGSVPQWMVSGGAVKDLPKLFEGVRKRVRERGPGTPVAGRRSDTQ